MFSVTNLFVVSLAIILTDGSVSMHNPFYCYSQDPLRPQLGMFSIRTAYDIHRGQSINANVSTCNPSKFWLFARHGTRIPFIGPLEDILKHNERLHSAILSNYERGRTTLCASDFELLRNWKFDPSITIERASQLTDSGWVESEELTQRYQSAFPSILSSTYSPNDYFFHAASTVVAQEGIRALADGLFGVNGHEQVQFIEIPETDYILRPDLLCSLYTDRIEQNAFAEGPEYQEKVTQVSAKLGFHGSNVLSRSDVFVLSQICEYEQVWHLNVTSPFCAAFSVANFQVMEYYEDVDRYYREGYGYKPYRTLMENLFCFQIQDLLRFLLSNDANDHKARIFCSSPTTFFLVTLGVFADDILLTRHNFAQQTNRSWRSSVLGPMGSNLAVIRYDCADGDNDVLFLYNEKPLQIDGCEPNGLCKLSLLVEKFGRFLDADCMDVFCRNS